MITRTLKILCLAAALAHLSSCSTAPPEDTDGTTDQPRPLYEDDSGWTVFTPSADTRIVYVSDDGNDDTAETYTRASVALGPDPRHPAGTVKAFKTFAAAYEQTREGHPDWILLKRGDTFYGSIAARNGRSEHEPFLVASYGSAPEVPLVKTGSKRALEICCESFNYIAVQGIEFYAHTRDFDSPDFSSTDGGAGFYVLVKDGHYGTGLLIEGCKFRFFTNNVIQAKGRIADVSLRRNVIVDNYSTRSHSQGLFASNASITLEENIFDHNGWYKQQETERMDNRDGGQATMFNHNTYFEDTYDVVFKNNIFLRPASIGNKWTANSGAASTRNIEISNNFYMDGEIGISMGGNKKDGLRFKNIQIRDNVLLNLGRSMPTDRDFAWYIDIRDWDNGNVTNNLLIHPGSTTTNNLFAFKLTGETRNLEVTDNSVYGFGNGYIFAIDEKADLEKVEVAGNQFYFQEDGRYFVRAKKSLDGIAFHDNLYLGESNADKRFSVKGARLSLAGWHQQSSRQGAALSNAAVAASVQPTSTPAITAAYDDLENLIQDYQQALGEPATVNNFITHLRDQSHTNWNADYTAEAINEWIRTALPEVPVNNAM